MSAGMQAFNIGRMLAGTRWDTDKFDISAHIDRSLRFDENRRNIAGMLGINISGRDRGTEELQIGAGSRGFSLLTFIVIPRIFPTTRHQNKPGPGPAGRPILCGRPAGSLTRNGIAVIRPSDQASGSVGTDAGITSGEKIDRTVASYCK